MELDRDIQIKADVAVALHQQAPGEVSGFLRREGKLNLRHSLLGLYLREIFY